MTDKEFKRLSRAQLIDIIYQLQLQIDKLSEEKQALEQELNDKRLRISNAGNIADAALELNNCFCSAQKAAEQYLNEIRTVLQEAEAERDRILAQAKAEAEAQREQILSQARAEAEAIVTKAKQKQQDLDSAINAILQEFGPDLSDNG